MKNYKLRIIISGKSAKELFCIGPKDLMNFLKEKFNVNKKDIEVCEFVEDLNEDEFFEFLTGQRPRNIHKDNYYKENKNE